MEASSPATLLTGLSAEERSVLRQALAMVRELMTKEPVTLHPDQPVSDAINAFADRQFRHLLVTEGRTLVGVLSDRDVLRFFAARRGSEDTPVRTIMSQEPVTTHPDSSVAEAIRLVLHKRINCLPVVVDDRQVVGILTTTDLLRALYAMQYWLERRAGALEG